MVAALADFDSGPLEDGYWTNKEMGKGKIEPGRVNEGLAWPEPTAEK